MSNKLDRVGCKILLIITPAQIQEGKEAYQKQQGFRPPAEEDLFHPSVILAKIHPRVKRGALSPVAVNLDGRPPDPETLAEPLLLGLAPAGMIDFRVDVRVEAV